MKIKKKDNGFEPKSSHLHPSLNQQPLSMTDRLVMTSMINMHKTTPQRELVRGHKYILQWIYNRVEDINIYSSEST